MLDRALWALRSHTWLFAAGLTAVLLAANVISEPNFGNPDNWPQQLATLAPLALIAFASTPAIVSGGGGLDLSVGPLAVLLNVFLIQQLLPQGIDSAWTCIPILVVGGAAVGAINGLLVGYLRYVPVIATLCMVFVVTGVTYNLGATSRSAGEENWTQNLTGTIAHVPWAVILMAVPIALWILLSRTSYHRALYATGGNDVTAFSAGVDVARTRLVAYAAGGVFAAFAAIALTALVQSSQPNLINQYILIGPAAVSLGGVSLIGGRGGLTGAFFGAAALYLIQTLLVSVDVAPSWLNVVYGGLLLAGVVLGAAVQMYRPPRAVAKVA